MNIYDPRYQNEWRQYLRQFEMSNSNFLITFSNYRPLSRGTVRLASRNPYDVPLIDPAYLSNQQDLIALTQTASIGIGMLESQYMAPYIWGSQLPVSLLF